MADRFLEGRYNRAMYKIGALSFVTAAVSGWMVYQFSYKKRVKLYAEWEEKVKQEDFQQMMSKRIEKYSDYGGLKRDKKYPLIPFMYKSEDDEEPERFEEARILMRPQGIFMGMEVKMLEEHDPTIIDPYAELFFDQIRGDWFQTEDARKQAKERLKNARLAFMKKHTEERERGEDGHELLEKELARLVFRERITSALKAEKLVVSPFEQEDQLEKVDKDNISSVDEWMETWKRVELTQNEKDQLKKMHDVLSVASEDEWTTFLSRSCYFIILQQMLESGGIDAFLKLDINPNHEEYKKIREKMLEDGEESE